MLKNKNKVERLRCSVQKYEWGRVGSDSAVAKLYAANSGTTIGSSEPYAELWMGTHESGPSLVNGDLGCGEDKSLKAWILESPSVLGDRVLQKWGCDLPFLFKVLSVAKPLSIQAHPDKVLAKELHKLYPNLYKDDNHKPEMALALTEFEALCGFLDLKELKEVVKNVPEIEDLVGPVYKDQVLTVGDGEKERIKCCVKSLFAQLMGVSNHEMISESLSKLKSRLTTKDELTPKEQLVLRLEDKYPNDIGIVAALLMNYVKLQPGEALYLGPNEPHAYLSGDCIECMATSDNVVRAGLTPKNRDVATLCSMLTYDLGFPQTLEGVAVNEYTTRYRPPVEEFEVDRMSILPEMGSVSFAAMWGPSILVVVEGGGEIRTSDHEDDDNASAAIGAGDVLFTPANTELNIRADSRLELYRAGVNTAD